MVFSSLFSAYSLLSLVLVLPAVSPTRLDVWAPTITYPIADTVWVVGGTYTVTWDTSSAPSQITNPDAKLYLRRDGATDLDSPIAQDFLLIDGEATVTIPWDTEPGTGWCVVLIGDSGDFSPEFTITVASS